VSDKKFLMEGVQLWSIGNMLRTWMCVSCAVQNDSLILHSTHADL